MYLTRGEFLAYTIGVMAVAAFAAVVLVTFVFPRTTHRSKLAERPMTGFMATLTPTQLDKAKRYKGDDA